MNKLFLLTIFSLTFLCRAEEPLFTEGIYDEYNEKYEDYDEYENAQGELITRGIPTNFTISPYHLITPHRFDIMAKYIYAKHYDLNVKDDWAYQLYDEHIRVLNNYQEHPKPSRIPHGSCAKQYNYKSKLSDFIQTFNTLLDEIKLKGFNTQKSVIPIDKDNVLLDGAHRVAACLLYNLPIMCQRFANVRGHKLSANYLKNKRLYTKKGLSTASLDAMALQYCNLNKDTYIVTMYPAAVGHENKIKNILNKYGSIVYKKEFSLNSNGSFNLMKVFYEGEKWIGNWKNNWAGARAKQKYCFPRSKQHNPIRAFLIETKHPHLLRQMKTEIRKIFKIQNHSVHVNDTHEESVQIAQTMFLKQSIHFLNYANQKRLAKFEKYLTIYRNWIKKSNINPECFCIDGSAILSAYGIRDCNDLDILHHGYNNLKTMGHPYVNSHNSEMHHHIYSKDAIIFNPSYHFYYKGVKFASLEVISKMKRKRGEGKDHKDIQAINSL